MWQLESKPQTQKTFAGFSTRIMLVPRNDIKFQSTELLVLVFFEFSFSFAKIKLVNGLKNTLAPPPPPPSPPRTGQSVYVQRNTEPHFVKPLLQWKSNTYYILWVRVCSLRYPACNAHAPYCHLWPVWLYNIFPRYLTNGTIFGERNLLNTKCVLIFSTCFV